MRKMAFLIAVLILMFVSNVFALDTSTDTGKTKKTDKEQSQSLKKSQEEKESKGKRKADTLSKGIDKQTQEAIKSIGQAMSQSGADVTLPLEAVFLDRIAQLETDGERKRYYTYKEIKEKTKKVFSQGTFGKYLVKMTPEEIFDCLWITSKCKDKEKLEAILDRETKDHLNTLAFFLEERWFGIYPQNTEMIERFSAKKGIPRSEWILHSGSTGLYVSGGFLCSIEDIDNNVVRGGEGCGDFSKRGIEKSTYDKYIAEMLADVEIQKTLLDLSQKYYGVSEKDFNELISMLIKKQRLWYEFKVSKFNEIDDWLDYREGLLTKDDLIVDNGYIKVKKGAKRKLFEVLKDCKIASNPKLPQDFGLSSEIRPGTIDLIKADYLSKAAQSNMKLEQIIGVIGEAQVRAYRNCLAEYGAIIAQAYLYLTSDLNNLKASIKDRNNITVRGIGYDDFVALVDAALQKALKSITNSTIKRTYDRATNDNSPCQFDRSIENIKCGSSLIVLGTKPQLYVSGIQWYGERFAGYQGTFKVSKSWSYTDALEKLKSTAKYSKWASEVSRYAEELESQGKVKEATMVRKKAWELAKSGKQTVSPAKFLPGH